MSLSLAANCGSLDSLNWRTRCGCRPWRRQMRCTELTLMPVAVAIMAAVQWVAAAGGSVKVRATTRSATAAPSGAMRERRVLSRSRPSYPSSAKRSCQRHTQVFDLPVWRMISLVPRPSALSRTIRARHTCFWAALRFRASASNRRRSARLTVTMIPGRIGQTRTSRVRLESPTGFNCQILSTSYRRASVASTAPKKSPAPRGVRGARTNACP